MASLLLGAVLVECRLPWSHPQSTTVTPYGSSTLHVVFSSTVQPTGPEPGMLVASVLKKITKTDLFPPVPKSIQSP